MTEQNLEEPKQTDSDENEPKKGVTVLSEEEASHSKPWDLPSFDDPSKLKNEQEDVPQLPTAEEIEAIRQSAFDEGREQGYEKGMQQAQQEVKKLKTDFSKLIQQFAKPFEREQEQITEQLAQLVIMVTRQLTRRELKHDPEQVIAVIRDSIKLLPAADRKVMVQLHPEDAKLIRKVYSVDDEKDTSWIISDDPSITRGGCIVSTDQSKIDATVEKRVFDILNHIFGEQRAGENDGSS